MMHGREKSDFAIVAGKPTNKVEQSTAEPAEPRAEAEGNASQQARTGRRTGKACHRRWNAYGKRQGKGRRRSSLRLSPSTIDLLEDAFDELKKDAAAGVDGLRWKEYAEPDMGDLDRNGRTAVGCLCRPVRRIPRHSGVGLENLLSTLRQCRATDQASSDQPNGVFNRQHESLRPSTCQDPGGQRSQLPAPQFLRGARQGAFTW